MVERKEKIGARRVRATDGPERAPLAIALDAKPGADGRDRRHSPRVVASGRGAVAEQILAIAFERGIPVREDSDLAEILSTLEVESEVPIDALAAVAEILSYVYRANRDWRQDEGDAPQPETREEKR